MEDKSSVMNGFEQFYTTQSIQISVSEFLINILLAAALGYILGLVYQKYSSVLSNRKAFSDNFVLLCMTTMLIIAIVKSSLALSLGLVGALSIVRFRAAIKEPEELMYLFFTIAVGLGLGADQRFITVVSFIIIIIVIVLKSGGKTKVADRNLYLSISASKNQHLDIEIIVAILNNYCFGIDMHRFDELETKTELSFLVGFSDHIALNNCKKELQQKYPSVSISFLDSKGLYAP